MPINLNFQSFPIITKSKLILTDSRFVGNVSNAIFFAINGERNNGHIYIKDLISKGVNEFVIENNSLELLQTQLAGIDIKKLKFWKTENAIQALQDFAINYKQKYELPVVGITGSNGKTTVKEWLSEILSEVFVVVKSPKSFNSQIGVPLSVLKIEKFHKIGVFEAGISRQNEMEKLEKVISPTIGIFTNIGTAHSEGFNSQKQKISEKLKLFKKSKTLIYCADNEDVEKEINVILKSINSQIQLIKWKTGVDVKIEKFQYYSTITFQKDNFNPSFRVSFVDDASIQNLINVILVANFLKLSEENIKNGLNKIKSIEMRMSLKKGIFNSIIIDDTYNNDIVGLESALNFMNQQSGNRDKVLIISEILQSGLKEEELFKTIEGLIVLHSFKMVVLVGDSYKNFKIKESKIQLLTFAFKEEVIRFFSNAKLLKDSIVLIKGARQFEFDKIVNAFSEKSHQTVLEINLDSLTKNFNFYKKIVGNETKIMAMVKAFAYGVGSVEVAELLQFNNVDYLAVAYTDEGVYLRQNGITLPIMVMNPNTDEIAKMIDYQLEPEVYSIEVLNEILDSKIKFEELKIHLKLDTGMHRLGFMQTEIAHLISKLSSIKTIKIQSIFSHLSSADGQEHLEFTKNQIELFKEMSNQIIEFIGYKPILHISNSAGIVAFPEAKFDMVRLGIGLYGFDSTSINNNLENVTTLKSVISQVKVLKSGTTVGYSRKGKLDKDSIIATIPIGYADGYDRRFGNGVGAVLVNGKVCKTVGNICMDMMMIDVTDAHAERNTEVIIFGEKPSIKEMASNINTISYEILTGISERVKRVFIKN